MDTPKAQIADFRRSARTDLRWWMMLVVGLGFVITGATVNPADNCSDSGECAPWLVPIAFCMGMAFSISGGALLLTNPRRGSRIDPETGDLVWWQNRYGADGGDCGRIHPSHITRIRLVSQSDDADQVHLYDSTGVRMAYFDNEVVPWPAKRWVDALVAAWPHIAVEER